MNLFPLTIFGAHFFLTVALFLVLFAVIAVAFARERFLHLLLGFIRNLGSVFYSPFIYLRKIVLELCDFGRTGDSGLLFSDQYLLNKVLIALKAAIILLAIGGLAASFTAAWEATLPPQALRDAIDQLEESSAKGQTELATARARVEQMDSAWQQRRQTLIEQFKTERLQQAQTAASDNDQIEKSARGSSSMAQALESIRSYLAQNESADNAVQLDRIRDTALQFLGRLSLSDSDQRQLTQYVNNWQRGRLAKIQMDSVSESQLRSQIQPDYVDVKNRASSLASQTQGEARELAQLKSQITYHPELGFAALVSGVFGFIFTIWIIGLLVESVAFTGALADDVKKIRLNSEREIPPARAA
jgi:hypothetical protein